MPPPGLIGNDQALVGEWEHLSSYCKNWSLPVRNAYVKSLKDKLFIEHLFINLWDAKFIQSELDPQTPQPPFDFCEREIYAKPLTYGGAVLLTQKEVVHRNHCSVSSIYGVSDKEIVMEYLIEERHGQKYMRAFFYNWPGCEDSSLVVFYRKRK